MQAQENVGQVRKASRPPDPAGSGAVTRSQPPAKNREQAAAGPAAAPASRPRKGPRFGCGF